MGVGAIIARPFSDQSDVTMSRPMKPIIQIIRVCAVAMLATTILASRASATSTLHIGPGANTSCAMGGCPIFIGGPLNGEVNNIEPTHLDIYQNSGGAKALDDVLLILSVPDNVSVPGALSASLYAPYPDPLMPTSATITAGASAYGINTDASGFAGSMTNGDVYGFLGLSGNNSNSFANYSAAELRDFGTSVSSFGIYLFSIDAGVFGGNDLLDIMLSGLPEGTFAVAYGESGHQSYDTPFTNAGMVDVPPVSIPEPGSLVVFGAALVVLGLMRRRPRGFTRSV
jgi:hypothetical protein